MKRLRNSLTISAVLMATLSSLVARELGFDERVRAQDAIERVHYTHQIDVVRPFDEAVPREPLERKMRTYLQQT